MYEAARWYGLECNLVELRQPIPAAATSSKVPPFTPTRYAKALVSALNRGSICIVAFDYPGVRRAAACGSMVACLGGSRAHWGIVTGLAPVCAPGAGTARGSGRVIDADGSAAGSVGPTGMMGHADALESAAGSPVAGCSAPWVGSALAGGPADDSTGERPTSLSTPCDVQDHDVMNTRIVIRHSASRTPIECTAGELAASSAQLRSVTAVRKRKEAREDERVKEGAVSGRVAGASSCRFGSGSRTETTAGEVRTGSAATVLRTGSAAIVSSGSLRLAVPAEHSVSRLTCAPPLRYAGALSLAASAGAGTKDLGEAAGPAVSDTGQAVHGQCPTGSALRRGLMIPSRGTAGDEHAIEDCPLWDLQFALIEVPATITSGYKLK